jgi:hypothetical protein
MAGDQCFVVMPFGKNKKIVDEDGCTREFNFDKIYDVIIRPAIEKVGMVPKIAREEKGSGIIHAEMFQDLRDSKYVIADLSLFNPNVLYELGVRHVMAGSGTVLICRRTRVELPFDIKLSRVIFYDYEGAVIDWQEAERVRPLVVAALEEARQGRADSPVRAFLERVLPDHESVASIASMGSGALAASWQDEPLDHFQQIVASTWLGSGQALAGPLKDYGNSVFGARALGYACLAKTGASHPLPPEAEDIATALFYVEQYSLANQIFSQLDAAGNLRFEGKMLYSSSISEEDPTINGAARGIKYASVQLSALPIAADPAAMQDGDLEAVASCKYRIASLRVWKYKLTGRRSDLQDSIDGLKDAALYLRSAGDRIPGFRIDRLAKLLFQLTLLLRATEDPGDRVEAEQISLIVWKIRPSPAADPKVISYLQWYQAIALADAGSEDQALSMAATRLVHDRDLMQRPNSAGVGRSQYKSLRRFIENYTNLFKNQKAVARISQMLQSCLS